MKILLLDDKPDTLSSIAKSIIDNTVHDVLRCSSITRAKQVMLQDSQTSDEASKISIIITDLNMSFVGLTLEQEALTYGSKLSGWIWLVHHVYNNPQNEKIKTIIYSEFITTLEGHIRNAANIEKYIFDQVSRVRKSSSVSGHEVLLKEIDKIV